MNRLARWVDRWQELAVWLPAALAIMIVAYLTLPYIDPRAGIDGWGNLWGQMHVAVGVMLAGFFTWLLRRTYTLGLRLQTRRELIDHAAGIERDQQRKRTGWTLQSWPAVVILALDHLAWLVLFFLLLSRFSP
jgi:hypothetical protein